jgi:hypothetical protein
VVIRIVVKRIVVKELWSDGDWNFAGSGKPATTFLKFLVLRIACTTVTEPNLIVASDMRNYAPSDSGEENSGDGTL